MLMMKLQSILVYTFIWGSIYLLISLGFSLVCGVLRIFHLGYGATFVLAAYGTWLFISWAEMGLAASIICMLLLQVGFALLVFYWGIFQRFLEQEEVLLTLSMLVFMAVTHMANHWFPVTAGVSLETTIIPGTFKIGMVRISYQMLLAALVGIGVTAAYVVFFLKTKAGLIIRAISQDTRASMLMGADVNRYYGLSMVLSVIPPAICTLMIAPFWSVEPFMGNQLLMTAMMVAILGGLGSLKGSIAASYMIGFIHASVSFLYISRFMGFAALVVTLIVMIFKRGGLYAGETIW